MVEFIVSRVEPAQLTELSRLAIDTYRATFSDGLKEVDIAEALKARSVEYFRKVIEQDVILVATSVRDCRIIGFIQYGVLTQPDAKPGPMEIRKLYIAVASQGEGVGRTLMNAAFEDPQLNASEVFLDVWIKNKRAISLYQSMGFKVIGEREFIAVSNVGTTPDLIMIRYPGRKELAR